MEVWGEGLGGWGWGDGVGGQAGKRHATPETYMPNRHISLQVHFLTCAHRHACTCTRACVCPVLKTSF